MQHSFDIEIAKEYGILEAILLNHIYYWIAKNKANKKHFYNGKYWTYNSRKAFSELFPYSSYDKIRRALEKLVNLNILMTGNFNKQWSDRTLWYTFTDKGLSIMQKRQMQLSDLPNDKWQECQMTNGTVATPIPNINTYIETNNNNPYNPPKGGGEDLEEKFKKFWEEYPKKVSKGNAEKWFKKHKPTNELVDLMIEKIKQLKETEQWKKDKGQFIPYPATWLNAKGWEDEILETKPKYDTETIFYNEYIGHYKLDENGRRIFV